MLSPALSRYIIGGAVYVVNSILKSSQVSVAESLNATLANLPAPELKWEEMAEPPVPNLDGAAMQVNNLLYVFALATAPLTMWYLIMFICWKMDLNGRNFLRSINLFLTLSLQQTIINNSIIIAEGTIEEHPILERMMLVGEVFQFDLDSLVVGFWNLILRWGCS